VLKLDRNIRQMGALAYFINIVFKHHAALSHGLRYVPETNVQKIKANVYLSVRLSTETNKMDVD
jgi:hypothetical protein